MADHTSENLTESAHLSGESEVQDERWADKNSAHKGARRGVHEAAALGTVPTGIPRRTALWLARGLSFWSGWPVLCVLSVDREAACWCEWWTDLLADIPERHLELRYEIRRLGGERRDR